MFRSEGAGVVRPKRAFVLLGALLLALVPLFVASAVAVGLFAIGVPVVHCVLFGLMSLSYGFRSIRGAKVDEGTLVVDDSTLRLGGRTIARRGDLKAAFVVPTSEGTLVHLERKARLSPSVFVRVKDDLEAAALLRELGFDAEHQAAEMRIASGMLAMPVWRQLALVLVPVLIFGPVFGATAGALKSPTLAALEMITFLTYVFGLAFAPTTVRIGTDGIVTRWLGRTRFIPHDSVEHAEAYDVWVGGKHQRGVRLTLRDRSVVKLPTGQTDIGKVEAARLAHRIEEARDARRRGAIGGTTDLLARGDRALADWIRHLRGIGAEVVDPRSPAVPHDVLLRIVEDSRASPLDRASAAVAATATGDDDARRRVRVAAETTASPKLRVALERIATQDDDAAIEETLDAISDERSAS